jgi:hypothetical protein
MSSALAQAPCAALGEAPSLEALVKPIEAVGRGAANPRDQAGSRAHLSFELETRVGERSRNDRREQLRGSVHSTEIHPRKLGSQIDLELGFRRPRLGSIDRGELVDARHAGTEDSGPTHEDPSSFLFARPRRLASAEHERTVATAERRVAGKREVVEQRFRLPRTDGMRGPSGARFFEAGRGWRKAGAHTFERTDHFEHSGCALCVPKVPLARAQRQRATEIGAEHRLNGAPFGSVVGHRAGAVRIEVADLGLGRSGILESAANRGRDAPTAWLGRGLMIRVAR